MKTRTDPLNNITTYGYDPTTGDQTSITDPLSNVTTSHYDSAGRIDYKIDALNNKTSFVYDNNSNLVEKDVPRDALSVTPTRYAYDAVNNQLSLTDPNGNKWTYTYNSRNQQIKQCDPNANCVALEYNLNGSTNKYTSATGIVDSFTYDALNRKTVETWGKGLGSGLTGKITDTYSYDLGNRITQVVDSYQNVNTTTVRTYNNLDQILTEQQGTAGTVTYTYDNDKRRQTMTAGTQPQVTYAYDLDSNLTSVSRSDTGLVQLQYDQDSRRTSVTYASGVSQAYTFDADSRITAITYSKGVNQLGNLAYSYDAGGRRIEVTGTFASTLSAYVPPGNQTNNYSYGKDGSPSGTGIAANSDGDITQFLAQFFTYNTRNQVAQDSNVNTPQNSQETFLYDPFGRRVNENYTGYGGSHVTTFLYDGSNVAQEQNSVAGRADVLNGLAMDDHFARTSGGVTMYYLTDALGSTIALTDSSGAIQTRYTYSAFGFTASSGPASDNPYQFAGRELVDNSQGTLYYNRARYLDTFQFLRFLSRDPMGLSSGNYLSLYAYAGNSPINGNDPSGMMCCGVGIPGGFNEGTWDSNSIAIEASKAAAAGNAEFGAASGNAGSGQTQTSETCVGSARATHANDKLIGNQGAFGDVERAGDAAVDSTQFGYANGPSLKDALAGEQIAGYLLSAQGPIPFVANDNIGPASGRATLNTQFPGDLHVDVYGVGDLGVVQVVVSVPVWIGCPVGTFSPSPAPISRRVSDNAALRNPSGFNQSINRAGGPTNNACFKNDRSTDSTASLVRHGPVRCDCLPHAEHADLCGSATSTLQFLFDP